MSEAVQGTDQPIAKEPPRRSSDGRVPAQLEVDTRLLGLIVATVAIWFVFNLASDGLFLTPRNLWNLSVQSVGRRDHGDGHGARHRVAQHRPVDRVDPRLHRHVHGHDPGRVDPEDLRARLRPAVHLAHRPGLRDRRRAPRSGCSRASSSPTSACRRSSSRSAACSSGAASRSSSRRARRSPRWTASSSCSAAGPRARSARRSAGSSAGIAIVAIIYSLWTSRRQTAALRLPDATDVGGGPARRRRLRRHDRRRLGREQLPVAGEPGRSSTRRRTTSRSRRAA